MLAAWVEAEQAMRGEGRHLSPEAEARLVRAAERALVLHNALAAESLRLRSYRWLLRPKNHSLTHMFYDCGGVNPRASSCYQDEDMVGRVKRMYKACDGRSAPTRTMQRYMILQGVRWSQRLVAARTGVPPSMQGRKRLRVAFY